MKRRFLIIVLLFLLLNISSTFAQSGASLGLAGFTALSRGVESVYWNPANLAFFEEDQPKFQMIIYSLAFGLGNNSLSFNSINKYIGDGESIYLTDEDKNDILDMIPKRGLVIDFTGDLSLLSIAYKSFGFGIETSANGNFSIPKDLYENFLFKLGPDVYNYSVSGGWYNIVKFKFSYGVNIVDRIIFDVPYLEDTIFEKVSAGVSVSYLKGFGYANIEKGLAKLTIDENGILPRAEFDMRSAKNGSGIGLDFGLSTYTNNHWKIGMVFENVPGRMYWFGDSKFSRAALDLGDNPLFILGNDQLSEIDIDSVTTDTSYTIDGFSKSLPVNFRLGVAKEFNNYLINIELGHVNHFTHFSLGGGVKFGVLHWYGSITRQLNNFNWNTALALDFKNYYFDIGLSSRGGLTLGSSKALFLGSSMRFGF